MTDQFTVDKIDEMPRRWGEAIRASLPQRPSEEEELYHAKLRLRVSAAAADLDADSAVACALCLTRRPRVRNDEPLYYPAADCVNVREPWHYHRDWKSKPADRREARRYRRRLRKGRLPQPAP